jgi:hypothetical protein
MYGGLRAALPALSCYSAGAFGVRIDCGGLAIGRFEVRGDRLAQRRRRDLQNPAKAARCRPLGPSPLRPATVLALRVQLDGAESDVQRAANAKHRAKRHDDVAQLHLCLHPFARLVGQERFNRCGRHDRRIARLRVGDIQAPLDHIDRCTAMRQARS